MLHQSLLQDGSPQLEPPNPNSEQVSQLGKLFQPPTGSPAYAISASLDNPGVNLDQEGLKTTPVGSPQSSISSPISSVYSNRDSNSPPFSLVARANELIRQLCLPVPQVGGSQMEPPEVFQDRPTTVSSGQIDRL